MNAPFIQAKEKISELLVAYATAVPSHIFSDYADPANVETVTQWINDIFGDDIHNPSDWRMQTFPDEPGGPIILNVAINCHVDLFFEFKAEETTASILLYDKDRVLAGECLTTVLDDNAEGVIGWLSWAKAVIDRGYQPADIPFVVLRPFCLKVFDEDEHLPEKVTFPKGQTIYINLGRDSITKTTWLGGGLKGSEVRHNKETYTLRTHHKNFLRDMDDSKHRIRDFEQLIDDGWVDLR